MNSTISKYYIQINNNLKTKKQTRLGISLRFLLFGLILLLYFPSPYITDVHLTIGQIYKIRYFFSIIIFILWCHERIKKNRIIIIFLFFMFFYGLFTLISFINNASYSIIFGSIKNMVISISLLLAIDIFTDYDYIKACNTMRVALGVLFVINFVTVILYPKEGLYIAIIENNNRGYFLGMRNDTIERILPFIEATLLCDCLENKGFLRSYLFLLAALLTYVLTSSANSLLCIAFILIGLLLYSDRRAKYYNATLFLGVSIAASVGLILFKIQYYFDFLIVKILHKSLTITERSEIWELAVKAISKNLFLGYGIQDEDTKISIINAGNSCHNYYLDLLYYGGVFFFIIFLIIYFYNVNHFSKIRNKKIKSIISIILGAYCILWIATPIHRHTLCYMFASWMLAYKYVDYELVNNKKSTYF